MGGAQLTISSSLPGSQDASRRVVAKMLTYILLKVVGCVPVSVYLFVFSLDEQTKL